MLPMEDSSWMPQSQRIIVSDTRTIRAGDTKTKGRGIILETLVFRGNGSLYREEHYEKKMDLYFGG